MNASNSDGCLETALEHAIIVEKECSNPGGIFRIENPENGMQLPTVFILHLCRRLAQGWLVCGPDLAVMD